MKKLNFRHLLLAMLLIALLCAALLNAYNFGRNAFASEDYASARRWYQAAAVLGDAKAQNNLAAQEMTRWPQNGSNEPPNKVSQRPKSICPTSTKKGEV